VVRASEVIAYVLVPRLEPTRPLDRIEVQDTPADGDDGEPATDGPAAHALRLNVDLPPLLAFCDELRYHYGAETAVFFAFVGFCFRQLAVLTIIAVPISIASIVVPDAKATVLIRGIFGLVVTLVWAPLFTRWWQRCYAVLRVRWALDPEGARLGLLDPSTQQKPAPEARCFRIVSAVAAAVRCCCYCGCCCWSCCCCCCCCC
jgi:hypothetical protein